MVQVKSIFSYINDTRIAESAPFPAAVPENLYFLIYVFFQWIGFIVIIAEENPLIVYIFNNTCLLYTSPSPRD